MKSEYLEWLELFGDAERRRCWLLLKALECSPLAQAIDLARAADEFLAGAHLERRIADMSIQPRPTAPPPQAHSEMTRSAAEEPRLLDRPASQKLKGLALSPEHREQLLQRFAQGARNAELASEFGLSKQQVQGIRMGSAREIAKRRDIIDQNQQEAPTTTDLSASVEEVVRYLRQQDDVVVPQEGGEFLVNARFSLPLEKLVSRANRMRIRQGKPEFRLAGHQSSGKPTPPSANGHPPRVSNGKLRDDHPIFWDGSVSVAPEKAGGSA
jgi:hypothetical protein